jgi:CDP-6-deoxy-D-xylo-4-hexulose-3-dehydrase
MVRECTDEAFKQKIIKDNPILNKDFIFIGPAHNFRSTEINAVIGLNQIKRLDDNNLKRVDNFNYFINHLDSKKYITNFNIEGQCNYAFIVVLKEPSFKLRDKIEATLREAKVEFRRGLSGGGNQTLQPYIIKNFKIDQASFPNVNHVHHFGWYIGNYPMLEKSKIDSLLNLLNNI